MRTIFFRFGVKVHFEINYFFKNVTKHHKLVGFENVQWLSYCLWLLWSLGNTQHFSTLFCPWSLLLIWLDFVVSAPCLAGASRLFGRPRFLRPWGFHSKACFVIFSFGFLRVWPSQFMLIMETFQTQVNTFVYFSNHTFLSRKMNVYGDTTIHLNVKGSHTKFNKEKIVFKKISLIQIGC